MITELPVERLDEVRDVWLSLHRHHSTIDIPPGWRPRPSDEAWQTWRTRSQSLLDADRGAAFVHASPSGLDGLAFVVMLDPAGLVRPVLEATGPHAELMTLAVADDVRGGGIGGELYAAAVDWARGRDAVALHIGTRATNAAGVRFYERHGAHPAFTQLMQPL